MSFIEKAKDWLQNSGLNEKLTFSQGVQNGHIPSLHYEENHTKPPTPNSAHNKGIYDRLEGYYANGRMALTDILLGTETQSPQLERLEADEDFIIDATQPK